MIIITMLFAFVILYKVKFAGVKSNFSDYLSIEHTNAIKGIMALIIMLHHIAVMFTENGNPYIFLNPFDSPMGWLTVSVFFFFSGYGLMYGFLHKGNYLSGFLVKKLPAILIPMLTVSIIYLPVQLYAGNAEFSLSYLVDILIGKGFLVKNSWYVYSLFVFYVAFFILFRFIKNSKLSIICFTAFIVVYEILCYKIDGNFFWSASAITIAVGVIWAYKYNSITVFCNKYFYLLVAVCAIGYLGSMAIMPLFNRLFHFYPPEFLSENLCCIFFVVFLLLIFMKFSIRNFLTDFLGKISYEIYLIHGLFMIVFSKLIPVNDYLFVAIVVFSTITTAWLINKLNTFIKKKFCLLLSANKLAINK